MTLYTETFVYTTFTADETSEFKENYQRVATCMHHIFQLKVRKCCYFLSFQYAYYLSYMVAISECRRKVFYEVITRVYPIILAILYYTFQFNYTHSIAATDGVRIKVSILFILFRRIW